jgi:hypothetical protein
MNLNSHHFDRIRSKNAGKSGKAAAMPSTTPCAYPGCTKAGDYRAPQGRDREGQYFCFCIDHVREYNATYDYFSGMSDDAVAKFQKEALVGHRPTWNMGVNRAAGEAAPPDDLHPDSLGIFRARARQGQAEAPRRPRYSIATTRALTAMGLDDTADAAAVKARYKQLVKQLHPDANGGDRSNEDKLRDIIRAYNFLKTIKLSPPGATAAR